MTDAVEAGGRLLTRGTIPRDSGNFYAPTIIDSVDDDATIACEEVFGPVVTVHSFGDDEQVVDRANDTPYGLYAAVWTNDLGRAHETANSLEAGTVAINEFPATFTALPFGGYKESGIGREKGIQALDNYTQSKSVTVRLGESPGANFER